MSRWAKWDDSDQKPQLRWSFSVLSHSWTTDFVALEYKSTIILHEAKMSKIYLKIYVCKHLSDSNAFLIVLKFNYRCIWNKIDEANFSLCHPPPPQRKKIIGKLFSSGFWKYTIYQCREKQRRCKQIQVKFKGSQIIYRAPKKALKLRTGEGDKSARRTSFLGTSWSTAPACAWHSSLCTNERMELN